MLSGTKNKGDDMKAIANYYKGKFMDWTCPICNTILNYYEDRLAEYMYCEKCENYAYNTETGKAIGRIPQEVKDA